MRTKICIFFLIFLLSGTFNSFAQLYTGMSGLIKNPSADMNNSGDAMISGYFLNKEIIPDGGFRYGGKKYDTYSFSLALTPFSWIEVGYTFTLMKTLATGHTKPRYNQKDRFFSIKLNPLREGKYYPAIAVGANDIFGSRLRRNDGGAAAGYFCNYYIVATKHFIPKGQDIGVSLGFRYVPEYYSKKWQGVIAGVTWRPKWVRDLRVMGEWTANEINIGVDCLLWKHLFLQAALINGKYPTGGIAYKVNLF